MFLDHFCQVRFNKNWFELQVFALQWKRKEKRKKKENQWGRDFCGNMASVEDYPIMSFWGFINDLFYWLTWHLKKKPQMCNQNVFQHVHTQHYKSLVIKSRYFMTSFSWQLDINQDKLLTGLMIRSKTVQSLFMMSKHTCKNTFILCWLLTTTIKHTQDVITGDKLMRRMTQLFK